MAAIDVEMQTLLNKPVLDTWTGLDIWWKNATNYFYNLWYFQLYKKARRLGYGESDISAVYRAASNWVWCEIDVMHVVRFHLTNLCKNKMLSGDLVCNDRQGGCICIKHHCSLHSGEQCKTSILLWRSLITDAVIRLHTHHFTSFCTLWEGPFDLHPDF